MEKNKKNFSLSDRPGFSEDEDFFDVENRFVNKIYDLIQDNSICPLTIAITGELGIGKSTVINRLYDKIKGDNKIILVDFEPLLEGKLEINEIIELFYMKLYQKVKAKDDPSIKELLKKCLKSVLILSRAKVIGKISTLPIPHLPNASASVEYNLGKNIDDFLDLWETTEPKSFLDQTRDLKNLFIENGYKLVVIIDEIDRLSANHIMNLLLFSRVLEAFQNIVCIVGLDYKQIISKMLSEKQVGMLTYDDAKTYLDKLFQVEFNVNIEEDQKINFLLEKLRMLDTEKILLEVIDSSDYRLRDKLETIVNYLSTPRQIKKWLISVKINYSIIKYASNKLDFLSFMAIFIKHPIILGNITNNTLPIVSERFFQGSHIKDKYGIDPYKANLNKHAFEVLLASMGIVNDVIQNNKNLSAILVDVTSHPIRDSLIENLVGDFFDKTPIYLILAFINGYCSESEIALYHDFFKGSVDSCIRFLLKGGSRAYHLAFDLSKTIKTNALVTKNIPSIKLLNELWNKEAASSAIEKMISPCQNIIFFFVNKILSHKTIAELDIFLSGTYINDLMSVHGLKNNGQGYFLDDFKKPLDSELLKGFYHSLESKELLVAFIEVWLLKVNKSLSEKNHESFSSVGLLYVLLWFVQWSDALNREKSLFSELNVHEQISNWVFEYLNDPSSDGENKKNLIKRLALECKKSESPAFGGSLRSPLEILFDNNPKLLNIISSLAKCYSNVEYTDSLVRFCSSNEMTSV